MNLVHFCLTKRVTHDTKKVKAKALKKCCVMKHFNQNASFGMLINLKMI